VRPSGDLTVRVKWPCRGIAVQADGRPLRPLFGGLLDTYRAQLADSLAAKKATKPSANLGNQAWWNTAGCGFDLHAKRLEFSHGLGGLRGQVGAFVKLCSPNTRTAMNCTVPLCSKNASVYNENRAFNLEQMLLERWHHRRPSTHAAIGGTILRAARALARVLRPLTSRPLNRLWRPVLNSRSHRD